jgi:hypothetical protein
VLNVVPMLGGKFELVGSWKTAVWGNM